MGVGLKKDSIPEPSSEGLFISRRFPGALIGLLLSATLFFSLPQTSFAIHAIIQNEEPLPRHHGALTLGMSLESFFATVGVKEEVPVVTGQFSDEHQYKLSSPPSSPDILNVVCDFYKGKLFRIELNYRPLKNGGAIIQKHIDEWTKYFGEPRVNNFPEVLLVFWDDGSTRMILQSDESEGLTLYSVTYIDDDDFHLISRERVQRETAGRSTYGKK